MNPNSRVVKASKDFRLWEFAYHCSQKGPHYGETYHPKGDSLRGLKAVVGRILVPCRARFGVPLHVLYGGGYDPVYDPEDFVYVTHRGSAASPSRTQHQHGAVDFRVGARRKTDPWDIREVWDWLNHHMNQQGLTGALGLYLKNHNRFIHVDLRPGRARGYFAEPDVCKWSLDRNDVELW